MKCSLLKNQKIWQRRDYYKKIDLVPFFESFNNRGDLVLDFKNWDYKSLLEENKVKLQEEKEFKEHEALNEKAMVLTRTEVIIT